MVIERCPDADLDGLDVVPVLVGESLLLGRAKADEYDSRPAGIDPLNYSTSLFRCQGTERGRFVPNDIQEGELTA